MLTSAKGLGNGYPIGATLCREWIAEDFGSHASTFSDGPVIAAAANATAETIVEEEIPANAAEMGDYLVDRLEAEIGDEVRDVRSEGLMVGIEVKRDAMKYLKQLAMGHQVLALPAGRTVLRLLPSLTITEDEVDEAIDAIVEVVDERLRSGTDDCPRRARLPEGGTCPLRGDRPHPLGQSRERGVCPASRPLFEGYDREAWIDDVGNVCAPANDGVLLTSHIDTVPGDILVRNEENDEGVKKVGP